MTPHDEGHTGDPELAHLRRLAVKAPEHTFARFRRRATLVQGTRMLFETQVSGFWHVLDAFLSLLFRMSQPAATPQKRKSRHE